MRARPRRRNAKDMARRRAGVQRARMKWLPLAGGLAIAVVLMFVGRREEPPEEARARMRADANAATEEPGPQGGAGAVAPVAARPVLTAAEKTARVARIRADYEAIRRGVADELAAAGAAGVAGPGPFAETRVFLRRLVLLQREERADLAQVLDAAELEELERRESPAGQLVAQRLGGTAATEEQRRAVFRIEREFDERFGFGFDLEQEALAERARVRREANEKVRAALGEELFRVWTDNAGR